MIVLSDQTLRSLTAAGWSPDYRCPLLERYVGALMRAGYVVHAPVRRFIAEFGGLRCRFPHRHLAGLHDDFHTLVAMAVDDRREGALPQWNLRLGDRLCVVGEVFRDPMSLLMDSRGRLFAGDGRLLLKLGDAGDEGLDNLCSHAPYAEID